MSKPRIAIYYDTEVSQRSDGAPLYVKQVFLREYAEQVELVHLAPRASAKDYGVFDFNIWIDAGEDCWPTSEWANYVCPKPNFYWISDMHVNSNAWKYRAEKAKQFDMIGCCYQQHIDPIKQAVGHDNVFWLPPAAEPLAYPYGKALKKYDVGFIGHLSDPGRIGFLDTMFKAFPTSFWAVRRFEEAAAAYQEMKVVTNYCLNNDTNMRHFEATCCGGFLLTPDLREFGLGELFDIGKEIVVYPSGNYDAAIERARYYVAHDEEREAIADAGSQRTQRDHTYRQRVKTILQHAKDLGLFDAGVQTTPPQKVVVL